MADAQNPFEAMIARLSADPALSAMAAPGTGILVWDRAGERLLWASKVAHGLAYELSDAAGRLAEDFRARDRLKALAADPLLRHETRLERLRLDPARPWLPVACMCRIADLRNGEPVLVTAIVGQVPKAAGRNRPAQQAVAEPAPVPAVAPPVAAPAQRPQGTIRFVWQADAQTRFTKVSPELAEAVGPMAADIVGQTWADVSRSVAEDSEGRIAALFARRETWSGRAILWRMDNTSRKVPVDWAGMAIFDENRALAGFRGFGLLRMDAVRGEESAEEAGSEDREETSLAGLAEADFLESEPTEEVPSEPASAEEETWFSHLRDRVAEALSGVKPSEPEPAEKPEPVAEEPRQAEPSSSLSHAERNAFREIAKALGARFESEPAAEKEQEVAEAEKEAEPVPEAAPPASFAADVDRVLDRLPIGILVHRGETILFANRFLLDLSGFDDVEQVGEEGGVVRLFRGSPVLVGAEEGGSPLALTTRQSENIPVEVRLSAAEWDGKEASLMLVRKIPDADASQRLQVAELDLRQRESRVHELESILDTATDGVIVLDETGRILSLNRSAEALFGYDQREVVGDAITVLLAPESHIVALGYLEGLRSPGVASLLNDGREVLGRVRQGGAIPLFMTMGRVGDAQDRKFCAVLRDITAFKKAEGELIGAKRAAEEASAQKSDLLAKISHEIRTPLNAIIGFAEVMLEERFGPIGNERYKEYLKDVHASGAHVISLVNDLLDLAKIEAGRLELAFTSVDLNSIVSSCFTLLQPQAARERIVMRTSVAVKLPPVVADERSVRQIVLNLVSNAIKFTDAGGQVIVSTALTDRGEVAFRVRDTGIGMSEAEVEAALEPFRQLATARKRGGTGLGLPLTKALVEANRGALQISSHPNEGTLVEVIFPPTRVLAE